MGAAAVKDSNNESAVLNFKWSLKPYLLFLKAVLGTAMDRPSGTKKNIALLIYGVLLLCLNVAFNVEFVLQFVRVRLLNDFGSPPADDQQPSGYSNSASSITLSPNDDEQRAPAVSNITLTTTDTISMIISMSNRVLTAVGLHSCFFWAAVSGQASALWDGLLRLEPQTNVSDYRRIRNLVFIGFLIFILV